MLPAVWLAGEVTQKANSSYTQLFTTRSVLSWVNGSWFLERDNCCWVFQPYFLALSSSIIFKRRHPPPSCKANYWVIKLKMCPNICLFKTMKILLQCLSAALCSSGWVLSFINWFRIAEEKNRFFQPPHQSHLWTTLPALWQSATDSHTDIQADIQTGTLRLRR